jgi:predicted N-formylglutamate amidohydrolase
LTAGGAPERTRTIFPPTSSGLLEAHDPDPAIVENAGGPSPFLIVCDHAGRETPRSLGRLGLPDAVFDMHIAWDIGVAGLGRRLGQRLGACVIAQAYSRLVIDCNRAPDHPQAILTTSDGVDIPGNHHLDANALEARRASIHAPYHARIEAELDLRARENRTTVLVCQHSFTPVLCGFARPWHIGVLHMGDSPISVAMLHLLALEPGLVVGENQPYAMDGIDYTAPRHAIARGLDYLEIEVRQDLIADAAGEARFADLLARYLPMAREKAASGQRG